MTERVPAESCDDTNESETPTESTRHVIKYTAEKDQRSFLDFFIQSDPHECVYLDQISDSDNAFSHHHLLLWIAACQSGGEKGIIARRLQSAADCRISVFADPVGNVIVSLEIDQPSTDGVITVELLPSLGFLRQELEIHAEETSTHSDLSKHDTWGEEFFQSVLSELPRACLIGVKNAELTDVRTKIETELQKRSIQTAGTDWRYYKTRFEPLDIPDVTLFLVEYDEPPKPIRPFEKWREWVRANVVDAFESPLKAETARPNVDVIPGGTTGAMDSGSLFELPWDEADVKDRINKGLEEYGSEILGWYQSFHVYDEDHAGIYLHGPRILDLSRMLHRQLVAAGCSRPCDAL